MNVVINIKTDKKIKHQAQKVASDLGLSLSGVINAYLRQFVRNQTLFVSRKYDEPSELLINAVESARQERKNGKAHTFKKPDEAVNFINHIISKKK